MRFVKISDHIIHATADAIRFKTGKSGDITPREMPAEILNISGNGVPILTKAEWNALTTAQKQAFSLVAINENEAGYKRGMLVNGADYIDIGLYLPYSDMANVICETYPYIYDGSPRWGIGETYVSCASCNYDSATDSIYVPTNSVRNPTYIDNTGTVQKTVYAVLRRVSGGNRLLSCFTNASAGRGAMLAGSGSIMFSRFADDTTFAGNYGNVSNQFIPMAFKMCSTETAGFVFGANTPIKKSSSPISPVIALGSTTSNPSGDLENPCDLLVKYVAVVSEYESDNVILSNLSNLYVAFCQSQ